MSRVSILAALSLLALPGIASAQANQAQPAPTPPPAQPAPPAPTPPPAEVVALQQAGMAFGQCVEAGIPGVPTTVTPEAGATTVISGCATQRRQLDQAVQAFLAIVPEAQRPAVQQQVTAQLGGIEAQVAAGIRQSRAPAIPAPTTAPAPAPAN